MRRLILDILAILSVVCAVLLGIATNYATRAIPKWMQAHLELSWILLLILMFTSIILALLNRNLERSLTSHTIVAKPGRPPRARGSYRKRYLEHIVHLHRDFDVKGLSTQGIYNLEQENIFVRLSIEPQPADHVSPGLIEGMPEKLRQGDHSIWDYLQAPKMGDHHFAVIGAPGSGKTTLLKHIALTFGSGNYRRLKPRIRYRTPIFLFLRDHIEQIKKNSDAKLIDLIQQDLAVWDLTPPPRWFESELQKRRCVVMFDGLDEVADPQLRKQVVNWAERQMKLYAKNWFITTSRPGGYRSNPLNGVHVLGVRPFTSEQVRQFIKNWYQAIEVMSSRKNDLGVQMKAKEGAEDLLRRLANAPALTELAANPLLLTMIATIHRYRSTLPGKRVELYNEICEVSLGKRRQAHDLDLELVPLQKQRVLEPLAYHMMKNQQQVIKVTDALRWIEEPLSLVTSQMSSIEFLKKIEETSGLLLERESGIYSFAHKTFQEYLAAVYIQNNHLEYELITRVEDPYWHETIRLYAARTDASAIIEACIRDENPSVRALALARECLREAAAIRPALRAYMENFFRQDVEDSDEMRRKNAAEALLASRVMRMARLNEHRLIDPTLVTHAEYQLFLDELRSKQEYHQPDYWPVLQFPAGQGDKPVVGVRLNDAVAFCNWLTERDGEWRYLLPKTSEGDTYYQRATSNIGYWLSDGQRFEGQIDLENTQAVLMHRIEQDIINLQILVLIYIFHDVFLRVRTLLSNATHERNLPLYRDQSAEIMRYFETMHVLAYNCGVARDYDIPEFLQSIRDLTRACVQDYAEAHELARVSANTQQSDERLAKASASDQVYINALTSTRLIVEAFTNAKPRINNLKNVLTQEFTNDDNLIVTLTKHLDLLNPTILFLMQTFATEHDIPRILSQGRLRTHIYTPDFTQLRSFAENNAFPLSSDHALTCARAFDRTPDALWRRRAASDPDRSYLRYWALMNAALLEHYSKRQSQSYQQWAYRDLNKQRNTIEVCYGIYIDLLLFEERIARNLPAVEGIRLVKEPRVAY